MSNSPVVEYLSEASLAIGIAVVGGLARILQSNEQLTFRFLAQGLLTSCFCGVLVALVLGDHSITHLMRAAGIAASGWAGPALLPHMTQQLKRVIDKFIGGSHGSGS